MIKLQIVGNLGKDSVVREVNGTNVINFTVAHSDRYRDSSGIQKERTTWVDCSYWTDRAGVAPYLRKGTLVYVEGLPYAETYTGKEGNAGVSLRLRVTHVQLLGSGPRSGGNGAVSEGDGVQELAGVSEGEDSDDLPF
jgi:single-strand DNA-binding protein